MLSVKIIIITYKLYWFFEIIFCSHTKQNVKVIDFDFVNIIGTND